MNIMRSLLAIALLTVTCVSTPTKLNFTETRTILENRALANGVTLRILPLGDSITWGSSSSDGNGYRWNLLNMLSGNVVQYIGSIRSGSMVNNNNEGHPGALISEISKYAENSLSKQPNVVLVMAGTNDVNNLSDPEGAPARLGSLIDRIIAECPDAAIIIAQITPIADAAKNALAKTFNAAIPGIVAARANSGAKVLVVDMSSYLTVNDLDDGLHPKDTGYILMARAWYAGIEQAAKNGWIREPIPAPGRGNSTACTTYLFWDGQFGEIAAGVGSGDAAFVSGWQGVGQLAAGGVGTPVWPSTLGSGVRLADMNGDGRDDYLWVHPETGAVTLYINGGYTPGGGVNWIYKGEIATGVTFGYMVMFADLNGDGLDDYIWVAPIGDAYAFLNGGEKSGGGWLWTDLGRIVTNSGATAETMRFADIDGDGRAECLIIGPDGSLTAWLNGGFGDIPDWQSMGVIATGIGDAAGVFIQDLNNDGRADYIWLDKNGAATAYINNRGLAKQLIPDWKSAGKIATGIGAPRDEIIFGDLNGDGKKDYVRVYPDTGALDVWLNTGTGGAYVVGDGTRFADMDGDGFDDYLAVGPGGSILLYLNHGYDTVSNKWIWENQGQIATGVAARKDIRIADLDGDGLADYLVVDEKSGAVIFWRNGGPQAGGGWIWENLGQVATGIGAGAGVQFADIDGDGKADYLWVDRNGAVTAYLNGGSSTNGWLWHSQGVIATGVGGARLDIKFHDIDGDGLADYLWVNRFDGSVLEWKNGGKVGEKWEWDSQGKIAAGVGTNGLNIQFANINGEGRSDYLKISPSSGSVIEWYNGCFGGSGGNSETPKWQKSQCTDPAVTNAELNPTLRWNSVDATAAWAAAVGSWSGNPVPGGLSFSQQISNLFHGPENMQCGVTADHNGCDPTVQCQGVSYPAGYFILNSLAQVSRVNLNFYDAVGRAQGQMTSAMSDFSSTFAPIKDKAVVAKLLLDFAGLGFALMAAPAWNIILKSLPYFQKSGDTLGTLKDSVNPLVSYSVTIGKDGALSGSKLDLANSLEVSMGNLITAWYDTIKDVNSELFSGSKESLPQLTNMIVGGKMMPGNLLDDEEIQQIIMKSTFGYLIPQAWRMNNPFPELMSDNDAKSSSVCYNNLRYFIMSTTGVSAVCVPRIGCTKNKLSKLPGISKLDGKAFGGVTMDDLVIGAVASYEANNNQNGGAPANAANAATISSLYDVGIRTPGVIIIPVCGAEEARENWNRGSHSSPNFPC